MKKFFSGLLAVCFVISLSSCTKVVYSHEDYMSRFKTKQDVINSFGQPTERKEVGKLVEWMYNYPKGSKRSNTPDNIRTVLNLTDYKKHIRFTIDENDTVINYATQGVNLAEKKPATGKTILFILGTLTATVRVAGLVAQSMFSSF